MLIQDIYRFLKSSSLMNESMSISEFRKEIKGKMGNTELYKVCTSYLKSHPDLKKKISLNDYLDYPLALWSRVAYHYENEKLNKMNNSQYSIVKNTPEWQLLAIFSKEASYNIAHNYLRQKNDADAFGSGPTWCISTKKADEYWNQYTKGKDYPIVFMILSKTNSLDRYAIVFDNMTQGQKNKNIEYSKKNFEKGYTIADMNGEIRDFAQKIDSRDEVIKQIESKFNVSFSTPIDKNVEGKVNLSKIIYDCFDGVKTLADNMKDTDINPGLEKILKFIRDKNYIEDFNSIKEFKEKYNLKYDKDYYKDAFDFLFVLTLHMSSFKNLIEKYSRHDFAHLMYSCILICLLDTERNIPLRSFLSEFNDDSFKKGTKDAITLLKKKVYPRLLDAVISNKDIQQRGIKFIDDFLNSKNNEDKSHPLYKFLSLIDTEGLMKSIKSSLPGIVTFNMTRAVELCRMFKVFEDKDCNRFVIENVISKRYGTRQNGKIFVRNRETGTNYEYFDKYFVGLNVEDFKSNFYTPLCSIVINRDTKMRSKSDIIRLLENIFSTIVDLSQNSRYTDLKNWHELEDELIIDDPDSLKKLSYEKLESMFDDAINKIIIHFDKQGFDLITRTVEKHNEMLIFKKKIS